MDSVQVLDSGMQVRVIESSKTGDARSPILNTPCDCHYEGRLINGTVFDSSYSRKKEATFAPEQVRSWTERTTSNLPCSKLCLFAGDHLCNIISSKCDVLTCTYKDYN